MDTDPPEQSHAPFAGRVVRLHFQCHAEIPIGSFLRVTGSTLWAPGTAASDPTDAAHASLNMQQDNTTMGIATSTERSGDGTNHGPGSQLNLGKTEMNAIPQTGGGGALYTSSVEMVTTPEEYPIWRTRKPVVIVIHSNRHRSKTIQHHYYRYLVVSPGGTGNNMHSPHILQTGGVPGHVAPFDETDDSLLVSTSSEMIGSTTVMQWEDPFGTLGRQRLQVAAANSASQVNSRGNIGASISALSLQSSATLAVDQITSFDYKNLPYRTLDIDVNTGQVVDNEGNTIRLDHWNVPEDPTFQPYLIREAINDENRRKLHHRLSDVSDKSDSMETSGEEPAPPPPPDSLPISGANNSNNASGYATPPAFGGNNRIFFVCFHLPVVVVKNPVTGEWQASWSESILAKSEGSQILAAYEGHWIGTVTTHPPLQSEEDKSQVRGLLEKMNCTPIFLDPVVRKAHYYGFCKQVLWPAFHNIDLLDMATSGWLYIDSNETSAQTAFGYSDVASDWDQSRLEDWWKAYQGVNQEFADLLQRIVRAGDIIWIHDYHLSLLPQRLAAWEIETFGTKVTRKVFFLHIPFPTSQIFRELESGERILQGMLHADVVGFHAFDHARHFLNAAKRILGLNYESLAGGLIGVNFKGSTVLVSMSNVSIEPLKVDAVLALPSVMSGSEEIRRKHKGRVIIGALDIGQRLSGAALKLLAYQRLLHDYPTWHHRVVMVQRLLVSGSRKADEGVTTREVRSLVKSIQDKFGPEVIDYQEFAGATLPMDQRFALWNGSDILMSTPIREGLNHWPMEFIYAHKEPATPGVVIVSEFSANSNILNGALRVNPYDIQATVATIDKALSMDLQEREGRRYRDIDFVSSSPSDKWVKNVLRDLRDATARRPTGSNSASEVNSQVSTPYATPSRQRKVLIDSTAGFLARETDQAFAHLSVRTIKNAYDACKRRLIFLDFNGTIVLKEPPGKYLKREILGTSGNKPPPEVLEALQKLSEDPSNLVYVVSGDSVENVISALGHLTGIGLAVSNGARFAPPIEGPSGSRGNVYSVGGGQRRWLTFDLGVDWDAVKRVALPVLSKYTARSNGSFVKLTSFSIGWSFYSCDPEWGSLQASHLVLELENELRAFDVRFVTLKGIVEIVPRKLNKGLIVKKVLSDRNAQDLNNPVDLILCFGDDISDEKMFTSVFTFLAEQGDHVNSSPMPPVVYDDGTVYESVSSSLGTSTKVPDPQYCFTVAVGKKASHASFYVNDAQEVASCLVMLAKGEIPEGGLPTWGSTSSSHLFT